MLTAALRERPGHPEHRLCSPVQGNLTQTLRENLELCSWDEILHSSRNELDLYVPLWIGLNVLMCKQEDGSVLINVRGTIHVSESTHTCTLAHTRTSTACCLLTLVYIVTVEKPGLRDLYTQFMTAAARGRGNGMGRGTNLPVLATSFVKNKSISQNNNKQRFVHSGWQVNKGYLLQYFPIVFKRRTHSHTQYFFR